MQHKSGVKIYGPRYWPKKETKLNLFIFLSIGHDGTQSNFCNINMAFWVQLLFISLKWNAGYYHKNY